MAQSAVLLVGHGAIAKDIPDQLIAEFRSLRRKRGRGQAPGQRELELTGTIRNWPRTAHNDPYREGLLAIARELAAQMADHMVEVAFNELCAPTIGEGIAALADKGASRVRVVTTMLTSGGGHSERDIPEALARARDSQPGLEIEYVWPIPPQLAAGLFAELLRSS